MLLGNLSAEHICFTVYLSKLKWVLDSGQKYLDENGEYQINSFITDIDDMQKLLDQMETEQ